MNTIRRAIIRVAARAVRAAGQDGTLTPRGRFVVQVKTSSASVVGAKELGRYYSLDAGHLAAQAYNEANPDGPEFAHPPIRVAYLDACCRSFARAMDRALAGQPGA